jgi:hypothetical protein
MGSVPRLGIGDRHTTAVWPAAFRAMDRAGFASNAIRNSLRELNLPDDPKRGRPARQVVEAARHDTFFTLDVSDILDYGVRKAGGDAEACSLLSATLRDPALEAVECITSPGELLFLAVEIERRRLPVRHVAPNFGVEKGTDYRCPDGLDGLERRVRMLCRIASEHALMLDCHSGDDLAKATRQVFGRAARGRLNFKVSPPGSSRSTARSWRAGSWKSPKISPARPEPRIERSGGVSRSAPGEARLGAPSGARISPPGW